MIKKLHSYIYFRWYLPSDQTNSIKAKENVKIMAIIKYLIKTVISEK